MVAMQVAEHRLQLDHALAVERHVHTEHAMRRGMMRAHGNFEQFALALGLKHRRTIPVEGVPRCCGWRFHCFASTVTVGPRPEAWCSLARASTSSCAVGSYSKSSGS